MPFLAELVASLEKHGHLALEAEVREPLVAISPATVDRLLQARRRPDGLRGVATASWPNFTERSASM